MRDNQIQVSIEGDNWVNWSLEYFSMHEIVGIIDCACEAQEYADYAAADYAAADYAAAYAATSERDRQMCALKYLIETYEENEK